MKNIVIGKDYVVENYLGYFTVTIKETLDSGYIIDTNGDEHHFSELMTFEESQKLHLETKRLIKQGK